MNRKVIELTSPYDGASLECDGMTRVLHSVLANGNITLSDNFSSPENSIS